MINTLFCFMTKQINDSIKFILLFFLYGDFVTKVRAAMNYMNVVVYDISSILFYHVYSSIAKRVAYFNSHPPKTLQHTTHPNLPNHKKKKKRSYFSGFWLFFLFILLQAFSQHAVLSYLFLEHIISIFNQAPAVRVETEKGENSSNSIENKIENEFMQPAVFALTAFFRS